MNNEPLRIAHVVGKWVGGGVEAVIMNYYRNIDRSKVQFDFIFDDDSNDIPYSEIESYGGKVIIIPPYQKIFEYHKALKKVLKEGNYNIVHSHINVLSVFSLYAAKCAGVPVRIAHSHSTSNKKEVKKNLLKQILRPFSKLYATDYMCCSEHAGRWLFGDREYDKGNVYLLNNAIDIEKFKYDESIRIKKRKEFGIKDDTVVIGHVGRFVEQKNHVFLIDIFNELHKKNSNSILMLVGQGPLKDDIELKVKKLGLIDSVKFLGQRNDVNILYQVFDIFCLPSLYEGFGMVLVEAQCSGCQCIASSTIPGAAKVTKNLYFLDLKDSTEIWINKILSIKTLNRKSENQMILEHGFSISNNAKKLFEFYIGKQNEKK